MTSTAEFAIRVDQLTVLRSGRRILDGLSFALPSGSSLAITGPSGSGKTVLGQALAGRFFFNGNLDYGTGIPERIVWVEQQHHFTNLQHTHDLYYQQRYNSYDTEETETVEESLGELATEAARLFREMGIDYLRDRRLIQLSNGENKKLQLLKARLQTPSLLILDQPFIGLDVTTREWLHRQLEELMAEGLTLILITSPGEIPPAISHVLELNQGRQAFFGLNKAFQQRKPGLEPEGPLRLDLQWLPLLLEASAVETPPDPVIEMREVRVSYGEKTILENINWTVQRGERWLLSGPNGAGKSTLLSLITADNPKAYANPIVLFGRKRGSGESIWDIKKKIGFISPELHLYFDQSATCFDTVASGLFDTIGLFRSLHDRDALLVDGWMQCCGISYLRSKPLFELSTGEQRAVLLVRALVKNPPLLILDEPCQGLDPEWTKAFVNLINEVCKRAEKTLVFVTHYDNDRPACIDRFLHLQQGRIERLEIPGRQ